jgi:hypothetical protein
MAPEMCDFARDKGASAARLVDRDRRIGSEAPPRSVLHRARAETRSSRSFRKLAPV